MVTPSLVMVGAPHFLSMTTLRPRGPRVTLTASASALTPRSKERRAPSSNCNVFAMGYCCPFKGFFTGAQTAAPRWDGQIGRPPGRCVRSLLDDGEHVARRQDEVLLTGVLHLGAAVLA